MPNYQAAPVEKKWQEKWEKSGLYKTDLSATDKPKYFILDMFPYPSGAGLHVGHPKGYIATDVFARLKMLQGHNVIHPMGWDAFGLPAENFALKNKTHPRFSTEQNVANYKRQLQLLGFTYDWNLEINTTDSDYYKWTQWIFVKLFEAGMAYESYEPINWCPVDKTGLANEDLEDGKCERCGSLVEKKPMRQWVLAITKYADRLLNDLDKLPHWEPAIKEMQRNWIGRSEGVEIDFKIVGSPELICVFTTRVDTIFGCSYVVLAPENRLLEELRPMIKNWNQVFDYVEKVKNKSDLERTDLNKDKSGVLLDGVKAVNPFNGAEVPVYIADYVLNSYGTGAVMAVPAHDERDYEFARKYGLPIKEVIAKKFSERRSDAVKRDGVAAVIVNDKKVLVLYDKKNSIYRLPAGGYEKEENDEQALLREIKEETGYVNCNIVEGLGTIEANFQRLPLEGQYRHKFQKGYLVNLVNNEKTELHAEDIDKFESMWVAYEEAMQKFATNKESWGEEEFIRRAFDEKNRCFTDDGTIINSDFLEDLSSQQGRESAIKWLEENSHGTRKINYKIKDWVFSRQRYWGEPIPIIHCAFCGPVAVPESELPVKLPDVAEYEPSGTGESPLAKMTDWVNTTCPKCSKPAKRETNTMPQWAGSSWYYLRYIDPRNSSALVDKTLEKYWSPVDFYVGGAEHATRHLIYARFWHKFLYDQGVVSYEEPFVRLQHVGLIMGEDGRKMSKRWGNVINPDDVVAQFGADSLRVYEMFMGPFDQAVSWSTKGLVGASRFLERTYNAVTSLSARTGDGKPEDHQKALHILHNTIKKVEEDIQEFKFNTAVAQLMIFTNEVKDLELGADAVNIWQKMIIVLSPFAPHIAEELWEMLGGKDSVFRASWPKYEAQYLLEDKIRIGIQVNGKIRGELAISRGAEEQEVLKAAKAEPSVAKFLEGGQMVKEIYVKEKLVSLVVKM